MPFVVLYDANVLYPSTLRDVLIRVAIHGLVQAKWTEHWGRRNQPVVEHPCASHGHSEIPASPRVQTARFGAA
jgi:hypothetical protein